MATCPNKNLSEWHELVASEGESSAYYLWDKYGGEVPVTEYNVDAQLDTIPQIEALYDFEIFEDRDKICPGGICNYTARASTAFLKEAGFNPYPNPFDGSALPVTVPGPLGDFKIVHYVSAVAIEGNIYIYDMPQSEFISNEFFGQVDAAHLKQSYKPRLISLDIDSIKSNYNLDSKGAANFIRDILNKRANNVYPEFRSYIRQNIENHKQYITDLEAQITSEGLMIDDREEYALKENERIRYTKNLRKGELTTPLTIQEENKVINFLRTKLKAKVKQYLPTKTDNFTLGNLIRSVTGITNFQYTRSSLPEALDQFNKYTNSEKFIDDLWNNFTSAKTNLYGINQSINTIINTQRLLQGFFKKANALGFDEALNSYSKDQQYQLRSMFSSNIRSKHASEKQMIFMLQKYFSDINKVSKVLNIRMGRSLNDLFIDRMKANAQLQKATTVLNYMKAVEFDPSYINESIAAEANRRYAYFSEKGDLSFQIEETESSKSSSETIEKVKQAAQKMGIDIQKLSDYLKGNPNVSSKGINGVADLLKGVIAIAEGKENVALTEEIVHVATAILEQTNPSLVTEMISKIGRFEIYNKTLQAYKDNKNYQLSNGKPDIRKIKKEAVDKLIAELIINQNEGSTEFPELRAEVNRSTIRTWWTNIMDFIRGIYKKSNVNIFEDVASKILKGEIGTVDDVELSGTFYQLSKVQEDIQKKVLTTQSTLRKVESKEPVDPLFRDTEEASNWYEIQNSDGVWERVKKRVTDRVKQWYNQRFFGKQFTPEEKEFNEFKRTIGIKFHKFMEEIHNRYFEPDGTKKAKIDDRPAISDRVDREVYQKLENYYVKVIESLSKNGKTPLVFSETMLYDPKEKEAGTLDLFVVDEEGTAHILDWKFMSISEKSEDIPWFKQGAFNVQLGRYKDILREVYGVKKIGMNRAIPILMDFTRENVKDPKSTLKLKGINVGSVNAENIVDLRLLPVSEKTESTGNEEIDQIVKDLNAVYAQIGKSKAINEEEREFKAIRLNLIQKAIRRAQTQNNIAPLIEVVKELRKEGEMIINDYNIIYKDKDVNSDEFTDQQLSDFAEQIREYTAITSVFEKVAIKLGPHIYDENKLSGDAEYDALAKRTLDDLTKEQNLISLSKDKITKLSGEFADKFIGHRNKEVDLLSPEAVIKGIASTFRGVSDLPLAALRILHKMVTNAKGKASRESFGEVSELMEIRKKLSERGGDLRKLVQTLYQKDDKNKLINKLIYKFDKGFYDGLKNNAIEVNRNKQWLYDNVDIDAYKEESTLIMNKNIEHIKNKYENDEELVNKMILEEQQRWDITRKDFNGWNNYVLARHPQAKWLSKEYVEIHKDPELLALYNYISKINSKAQDIGYIQNKGAATFLPFVRKTMAESLAWDFDKSAIKNWGDSFSIDASTVGYGAVNELTAELEHGIPKYYTNDFTLDKDGIHDYSDVSEDIFRNMILYTNHVNKYAYLSAIEGQLKLVKDIEQFKNHLLTSTTGDVQFDSNGKPIPEAGNADNFKLFDSFLRGVLYEERYPLTDSDVAIDTGVIDGIKKLINRVVGVEVFHPSENPSAVSLIKTIDMVNRGFQLKTLGFEFISGAVNIFGGNIQIATQAGNYFKAREFAANEIKLIGNKFTNDDEREMFVQLIDTFMPLKDDPTYDMLNESGMSTLTRVNFSDALMVFMRQPEQHLEKSVFLTLLQNTMIVDGKIISIREHVKKQHSDRYSSSAVYRENKEQIEKEVEELKSTKSIDATKQLVNGKLVIPGLDLTNSNELQRLTNLTRRISRNATGGIADSDINMASMNIWLKSMMVFKMWIPKLLSTRFSHFERIADDFSTEIDNEGNSIGDKYDIGRIRLWAYTIATSIRDKSTNIHNILAMNEKGILVLDKMYEDFAKDYLKRTGKQMNISKEDFNDLILNNLRNQMKELAVLTSLFAATLAIGMMKPPDDADKATKNFYKWSQKVLDKFVSELSFFYNPIAFEDMLSGGMFPAMGLVEDIRRFIHHFMMQTTGLDISNSELTYDEVLEKAQPIKNFAKMLPFTKSMVTYGAIFSSDFAEEFDVDIQKGNRR